MLPSNLLKPIDRVMQTLLHMCIVTRSPNFFKGKKTMKDTSALKAVCVHEHGQKWLGL